MKLPRPFISPFRRQFNLRRFHPQRVPISLKLSFRIWLKAPSNTSVAGNIFQVVLSQRFSCETSAEAFDVYRTVRRLNPSPYMFFFDFGIVDGEPYYLVGSSLKCLSGWKDEPLLCDRLRAPDPRRLTPSLTLTSQRTACGPQRTRGTHHACRPGPQRSCRVCEYGTVKVSESFSIERYSHVMHIVSHVEGTLRPNLTAFDLVRAAFPAGTVSGAPKVRAMESSPNSNQMRAVRMQAWWATSVSMVRWTLVLPFAPMVGRGNTFSVQAGAGIVADSDPAREYQETVNKASAMLRAIEIAGTNS